MRHAEVDYSQGYAYSIKRQHKERKLKTRR
nr:MAG TPA: hypothetical protein [Caudoviricetes sp.]